MKKPPKTRASYVLSSEPIMVTDSIQILTPIFFNLCDALLPLVLSVSFVLNGENRNRSAIAVHREAHAGLFLNWVKVGVIMASVLTL